MLGFLYISYNSYSNTNIWECLIFYRYYFSYDFYIHIFCIKYYLIEKEKLLLSYEKWGICGETIHIYLIDTENREYEACSKILSLLEGNETIDVIIKNRDILEVLAQKKKLKRRVTEHRIRQLFNNLLD